MFLRILVIISFVLGNCFLYAKAEDENLSQPIPGQFIVKFKDQKGNALDKAAKLEEKHGSKTNHVINNVFKGAIITIPPGKEKDLADDSDVEQVVQDFTVYAIKSSGRKPSSSSSSSSGSTQTIPTGINWVDAELNTTNKGNGTTVAVLDTGIDFSHPDLMVNISLSRDFSGDGTGGNDNNTANGTGGHGTHVAGVVAALDNSVGVRGVAPEANLIAIKVLNRTGSGSFGSIISGLDYVTANANIIGVTNSSLGANGGTNPSQSFINAANLLHDAYIRAANAGIINVVAAGNESVNITSNNSVPAMFPEVITVSAVDDRNGIQDSVDKWASFSNFGTEVDIIAPGVNILSTAIGGGTSSLSGTSFSSPHVAGTVALYIAKNGRHSSGDARLLSSLISTISQTRSSLSGEPADGFIEPSCYANGIGLK